MITLFKCKNEFVKIRVKNNELEPMNINLVL
jgi:hypothetical protein